MKKIQGVLRRLAFFGLCALALAGCANPLLDKPGESGGGDGLGDIPEGYGVIGVSFSRGAARTVMPPVELDQLYLKYFFTKDGEEAPVEQTPVEDKFILERGSYRLEVEAYADGGYTSLAARGETEEAFVIAAGKDAGTVDLTLHPVISGGVGTLEFSLSYPAGATIETLTLTRIADDDSLNLKTDGAESGGGPLSGTQYDIPAGYYLLRVTLKKGGGYAGKTEVVHIYQNMTTRTEAGYSFSDEDFNAYLVTSAGDSGPGTLRQAVTDLNALEELAPVIQVMLEPGSVIELESGLYINKSLIIEGNGVTLTRAASWTTVHNSSQLLCIATSLAEVTISRVHFKDGRANSYGGAIRNAGTLTLESCIFSGNRTTGDYGSGGAIYSTNALTIRGCTFYGNTSGSYGGAVYFSASGKTLTLAGNLFYGNTASYYPVVDRFSGTVNASYNVADTDFGTGTTQCGWTQGTGDTQATALPVSGKTFKLLAGSGAADALPSPLPADYPAADFYGNPISAGGAAGAVQASTANQSGYYLELSVNNPAAGSLAADPVLDEDGLYAGGSVTITANPNDGYSLGYWLVNGVKPDSNVSNTLDLNLSAHTRIQAVFSRAVTVSSAADSGGGTLREALSNAQDGDIITMSGVTPGATVIELESALPEVTKSITIVGNGVTLTRAASWTTVYENSQLLRIVASPAEVTISRVHFKDGWASYYGGAIKNGGTLTLESCIFSGNRATDSNTHGGTIFSSGALTIRGCTFYGNTAESSGGAVYFEDSGTLTLVGNLFYGNTASYHPVVYCVVGTVNASYNVVDTDIGTGFTRCGWTQGTGDTQATAPSVSGKTFKLLAGSGAAVRLPSTLPADYPAEDFYGNPISGGGAAGAAQASTANQSGYYLELSVNNPAAGSLVADPVLDEEGLYAGGSVTVTANSNAGYSLERWLVNGVKTVSTAPNTLSLNLSAHTRIQAVFSRAVTVSSANDSGSGTLREALSNAQDGDVITMSGVGATVIELESALPAVTKSIVIKGNGVTLTRAASWTTVNDNSQLLRITSFAADVTISRVHFKDGRATVNGGAILNAGTLTLESCIFSGNRTTGDYGSGGAIYSTNALTIRGCTFYGNTSGHSGGAVDFYASGKTLTLTGNLFYGNTASRYPVVYRFSGTVNASYNVADTDFGTGTTQCGWARGTGDATLADLLVTGGPFDTTSFVPVSGLYNIIPVSPPADFPATDFYGNTRANRAPGAVNHE